MVVGAAEEDNQLPLAHSGIVQVPTEFSEITCTINYFVSSYNSIL